MLSVLNEGALENDQSEKCQEVLDCWQLTLILLFFQPLDETLKKALTGHLEEVVLALLKTPAQFDADELRAAMKVNAFSPQQLLRLVLFV